MSNGSSGTVKFVLGVQNEEDVDSSNNLGVRSEVSVRRALVQHVQEVLNIAQVFFRLDNRKTSSVAVACSSNGRCASKHSVDMFVSLLLSVIDVCTNISWVSFGVERAQSSHKSAHHSHGVSVMSESFDERLESGMVVRVLHDFPVECA